MIKRLELTDPNSCMSRARDDEMTFVLLGRDAAAPETIRFWVRKRIEMGKNEPGDPQIVEALACADRMWQDRGGPVRKNFPPAYQWRDIEAWINKKHECDLRQYGPDDGHRCDFWHFLLERCDIKRGSFFRLPELRGDEEPWQTEILDRIYAEFPDLRTDAIWADW